MNQSPSSLERLAAAQALFYTHSDLDDGFLMKLVADMSPAGTDWGDIYLQQTVSRSWIFDEGAVKTGSFSIDRGAGLRTVCGETQTLAYTDVLSRDSLKDAARTVAGSLNAGRIVPQMRFDPYRPVCGTDDAASNELTPEALDLIRRTDAMARAADPRITDVVVTLQCEKDAFLLARLDGLITGDVRPMVYLSISVIATENGRRERASAGGGSRSGPAFFTDKLVARWVRSAVDEALHNLSAKPAPAGVMPVVLGPGWPGILLHEAVGHGLEGDFIRKGTSAFTDRIGTRVASPGITVVDDGTLPRMTNTFMLAGTVPPEDIIRSVKKGIYAANFSGGQVDITSGKFVFAMSRAWMIENGELTYPVKGAMLSGSGPEALKHIPLIGSDLALDEGTGQCGKDGQQVPVGVGMPTVRIDALTVGGTELSEGV